MTIILSVDLHNAARRSDGDPSTWSDDELTRAICRYHRFLELVAEDPNRPIAPTRDIDEVWHLHMLSPRAYFEDCQQLFGEILDHDGGFGKGEGELPQLLSTFEDTAARWQAKFGEPYVQQTKHEDMKNCWHDCQGRCWHACKSNVEVTQAK
ncbi:MAG: glycine-rich domain-containing protein-like [Alphaproteobacteria bacterium]|nr:glycine-rich domain-containing protein-like [Alphaproteobacteria bacterium]